MKGASKLYTFVITPQRSIKERLTRLRTPQIARPKPLLKDIDKKTHPLTAGLKKKPK